MCVHAHKSFSKSRLCSREQSVERRVRNLAPFPYSNHGFRQFHGLGQSIYAVPHLPIFSSTHPLIHSLSCSICGFFYSALCLLFCVICPPSSVFCLLTSVSFTAFRFYSILLNIYYIIPRFHSQVNSGKISETRLVLCHD